MRALPRVALVLALAAVGLGGCYRGTARSVSLDDIDHEEGWVLVRGVPVIRQESAHDCGAAALAMVLERWGVPNAAPAIRREVVASDDRGASASGLRRYARERGFRAYLISGAEADLEHEIGAQRPVLVGLVQRYTGNKALSHYEVVVGLNPSTHRVLLLDPGHGPREDELASFEREWQDAGRLTLVVAPS
ncbi:MAG TPA: cysteine peptidase family C39 domain-containing protein [Polyangia bacterium]|nr:cysteine peptidase family C39 domain-containing protein [Polyangia bacterium]